MDIINVLIGILLILVGILLIKYYIYLIKINKHDGLSISLMGAGVGSIMMGASLVIREIL